MKTNHKAGYYTRTKIETKRRNSITAIIHKTIRLTVFSYHNGLGSKRILSIERAAVNEIIRLNAEDSPDRIAGIDFQSGVDDFLGAVKVICEDYNEELTGGCPRKEQRP